MLIWLRFCMCECVRPYYMQARIMVVVCCCCCCCTSFRLSLNSIELLTSIHSESIRISLQEQSVSIFQSYFLPIFRSISHHAWKTFHLIRFVCVRFRFNFETCEFSIAWIKYAQSVSSIAKLLVFIHWLTLAPTDTFHRMESNLFARAHRSYGWWQK